jgi:hypothetical protein
MVHRGAGQRGAGFGVPYAQAKDKVCPSAQQRVEAHGERSMYFGPRRWGSSYAPAAECADRPFIRDHLDYPALAQASATHR